MVKREFNLLDEPWIVVMGNDGITQKVSVLDAFENAGTFCGLAGEMPTQDAAVLRLLLAMLHTVVSRYDENGDEAPIESPPEAVRRWKGIWEKKRFPMDAIRAYLQQYRDRFWLFDEERPFFQVPELKYGTQYDAPKLNGEMCESNNKVRLFPHRAGRGKEVLDYDEAARWLICTMAFDDAGGKKQGTKEEKAKLGPMGVGWLGKIGLVMAEGHSLFETLMLNLVLVPSGIGLDVNMADEQPEWERTVLARGQRSEVPVPDNLSRLYTLQSRRICLERNDDGVVGYTLYGGDWFNTDNVLIEQMTCWKVLKQKDMPPVYMPKQLAYSGQLWKEFASLVAPAEGVLRPGVVNWITTLKRQRAIARGYVIGFSTLSIANGSMMSSIDNIYSDRIAFNTSLLSEKGANWVPVVTEQVETSKKLVDELAYLAQKIAKATGNTDGADERDAAKETAYFRLDIPFREWLEGIDDDDDGQDEAVARWWNTAQRIIRDTGHELVAAAGPQAFTGRTYKKGKKESFYCAPDAYNYFLYRTSSQEILMTGGKRNG